MRHKLMFFFALAGLGAVLPVAASHSSATGSIARVAEMTSPRSSHTATLLPNGKVLVAGGMVENGVFLDSADLFDPASGRFTLLPAMSTRRTGHSATLLRSGKVLLAGGLQGREYRDGRWRGIIAAGADLFDPATNTFTSAGAMQHARYGHEAFLLPDGKVLIVGGVGALETEVIAEDELYDPSTGKFVPAGTASEMPAGGVAIMLPDGTILVTGGGTTRGMVSAAAAVFDPRTSRSTPVGSMRVARYKHAATLLDDGRVLITGGSNERDWNGLIQEAEVYDPSTRSFSGVAPMAAARFKHWRATALLKDGRVVIAGGADRVEVFDPKSASFQLAGTLGAPIFFASAVRLADGKVLVSGGYGYGTASAGPKATSHAWIFTP
jgi:hypothetical protein